MTQFKAIIERAVARNDCRIDFVVFMMSPQIKEESAKLGPIWTVDRHLRSGKSLARFTNRGPL